MSWLRILTLLSFPMKRLLSGKNKRLKKGDDEAGTSLIVIRLSSWAHPECSSSNNNNNNNNNNNSNNELTQSVGVQCWPVVTHGSKAVQDPQGPLLVTMIVIIIIDIYIIYDNNNNNNYMYLTSLPHSGAGAGPPRSHSQLTLLRRLPRPQVREHWIVDNVKIGLNSPQLHNCSVISYK